MYTLAVGWFLIYLFIYGCGAPTLFYDVQNDEQGSLDSNPKLCLSTNQSALAYSLAYSSYYLHYIQKFRLINDHYHHISGRWLAHDLKVPSEVSFQDLCTLMDRIIMIKKTRKEREAFGGITVYFYDDHKRIVHAHVGGYTSKVYCNLVTLSGKKLFDIPIENIELAKAAPMLKYLRLIGLMVDKYDLLYVAHLPHGPFGCFGNLLKHADYTQKVFNPIKKRYKKLIGQTAPSDTFMPNNISHLASCFKHSSSN